MEAPQDRASRPYSAKCYPAAMSKRISLLWQLLAGTALWGAISKLAAKLWDNAWTGFVDGLIGTYFGITEQRVLDLLKLGWDWIAPLLTTLLMLYAFHLIWSHARKRQPLGDALAATATTTPPTEFIPIHLAIAHVAKSINDKNDDDRDKCFPITRKTLRQAAVLGKLRMRGCREIDGPSGYQSSFSEIHTDIPSDYWKTARISPIAIDENHAGTGQTMPEAANDWGPDWTRAKKRIANLCTNWDDLIKLWPVTNPTLPIPQTSLSQTAKRSTSDDRGLLDYQADALAGFNTISQIMADWTSRLNSITTETGTATTRSQDQGESADSKRMVMRALAKHLREHTYWLRKANVDYRQALANISEGLYAILSGEFKVEPDAQDSLRIVLDHLEKVKQAANTGQRSILQLVKAMDNLPRIEKEFNLAKRDLSDELKVLIENVDDTSTVVVRARRAGGRLLQDN